MPVSSRYRLACGLSLPSGFQPAGRQDPAPAYALWQAVAWLPLPDSSRTAWLRSFQGTVSYSLCKDGMAICSGAMKTAVGADTSAVVGEVQWVFDPQERLELRLYFAGEDGTSLAERTYRDVFYEFPGMAGQSIDNELGMRTYYFDEAVKERARTC